METEQISVSLSHGLAMEFRIWFETLSQDEPTALKAFSGMCPDGRQFVLHFAPLPIEREDSLDFIQEVLAAEGCVAFVHSLRVVDENENISILIYAGQEGEYWFLNLREGPTGLTLLTEMTSSEPMNFFHEMLKPNGSDSPKKEALLQYWNSIREHVYWRTAFDVTKH